MSSAEMKQEIRLLYRKKLRTLPAGYTGSAGKAITDLLLCSESFQDACTVFCYVSILQEPDTRYLITQALSLNKTVCVPRCLDPGQMEAVQIRSFSDLTEGKYGIPAPRDGLRIMDRANIDLAVVPCLCAGKDGGRLGHGGGYYDRFLAGTNALKCCLCYGQLLTEGLPMETKDIRMDRIITENGIFVRV